MDNYWVDLKKFPLKKFQESLKKRDMIPSRLILKDNIDKRCGILKSNGVENLWDISDLLKTKPKIEEFSNKTGLSVDYLTILKREVNSFRSGSVQLKKFPGIDENCIEKLSQQKINNSKQLFNKTFEKNDRIKLAETAGIPIKKLDEIISLSDLVRAYGVGPHFARIIFDIGITSISDFIKHKGEYFIKIYEDKTSKKADFSAAEIDFSIDIAKELKNYS